jgi:hypothetical protein
VAAAVTALPQVEKLTTGHGVEFATLAPGGKVVGVRGDAERMTVNIVAAELPLAPVTAAVSAAARQVLRAHGDSREVDVYVDDVADAALRALSAGRAVPV